MRKLVILSAISIMLLEMTGCASGLNADTIPAATPDRLAATTLVAAKTVTIETPQNAAPPIVRISGNNYSIKDMYFIMHLAADSELVGQSISNPQGYLDSAIAKAENMKLNSGNLKDILIKLVTHIDQLDFKGKNLVNGVEVIFLLNNKTTQLPYLIEKAKFQGREAWLIALNWEVNPEGNLTHGSHVALIVFKYGTDRVLFAMSCG